MPECIICRTIKSDMSDEHVIPDSLGGFYHIHNVCIECNSTLGSKVDSKLVNHVLAQFMRHKHSIKGKSSTIPNPFSGVFTVEGNPTKKAKVLLGKDNKPITYFLPNITYEKNSKNEIQSFKVELDISDEQELQKIVKKIELRNGVTFRKDTNSITKVKTTNPTLQGKLIFDIRDFKIGILKIAYEFAVDTIPKYYDTKEAKIISKALYNYDLNILDKDYFIGTGFEKNIKNMFDYMLDISSKKHYLIISNLSGVGLICMVFLHDVFSIGVILSTSNNLIENDYILGVNDINDKSFNILNAQQALEINYSKPEIRFEYNVSNHEEAYELLRVQEHTDFDFYKENNKIPLYDINQKIIYPCANTKIDSMSDSAINIGDPKKELTAEVHFDEDLFIRLLPSNHFFKVVSARVERKFVRKI